MTLTKFRKSNLKDDIRSGKKWITILTKSIKAELNKRIPDVGYVVEKANKLKTIVIDIAEKKRELAGFGKY